MDDDVNAARETEQSRPRLSSLIIVISVLSPSRIYDSFIVWSMSLDTRTLSADSSIVAAIPPNGGKSIAKGDFADRLSHDQAEFAGRIPNRYQAEGHYIGARRHRDPVRCRRIEGVTARVDNLGRVGHSSQYFSQASIVRPL